VVNILFTIENAPNKVHNFVKSRALIRRIVILF